MKKILFTFFIIILSTNSLYAASSSGSSSNVSNYNKAVKLIKFAKKYEKKGKVDKANKRYEKAFKLLLESNKKKPNKANTLNYLGFTSRKLGDFKNGEKMIINAVVIENVGPTAKLLIRNRANILREKEILSEEEFYITRQKAQAYLGRSVDVDKTKSIRVS